MYRSTILTLVNMNISSGCYYGNTYKRMDSQIRISIAKANELESRSRIAVSKIQFSSAQRLSKQINSRG